MTERVYLASALFSEAERNYNRFVADALKQLGLEIFLPQDGVKDNGQLILTKKSMGEIFKKDVSEIDKCDFIVAIIEGTDIDSGTAWEIGYAYATKKPVFGLRTDSRIFGGDEHCNLMIEESIYFCKSLEELLEYVKIKRNLLK